MIDTHCHLEDLAKDEQITLVCQRAITAGVRTILGVGVAPLRWAAQKMVAQQVRAMGCTVAVAYGIHPWWADRLEPAPALAALAHWLDAERGDTMAIGEIGLDFAQGQPAVARQMALFKGQITLAVAHDLPVILHERKSADQLVQAIRQTPNLRGVVHGFVGSRQQAEHLVACGFYLGVGAAITHPRATRLRALLAALPVERLLLESDAPNQPGALHRGACNEPAFIGEQLAVLAALRGTDAASLSAQLDRNALDLFGARLSGGTS